MAKKNKNIIKQLSKNIDKAWNDLKKNPNKALNNLFNSGYKKSDHPSIDEFRKGFIDSSASSIQDPLFLSFGLKFEFFPRIGDMDSPEPGLLSGYARNFLNSRNDIQRVIKLDYFTRMLQKISVEEPWFFQSITGINNLFDISVSGGFRVKDNSKLTIKTLETINMRMISLMESYRDVAYDKLYMRDMLPGNLKKFDMSIYITDPRLIYGFVNGKREYLDDVQGVIILKLLDCTFNFDSIGDSFSNITNTDPDTMVSPNFTINVGRVNEIYNLPTRELFGYGGNGYFSNDYIDDYNFVLNLLRPPTMNYAEAGNERRITLFSNAEYEQIKQRVNQLNDINLGDKSSVNNIGLTNANDLKSGDVSNGSGGINPNSMFT